MTLRWAKAAKKRQKGKRSVRENVIFPPGAVRPSEPLWDKKQPLTAAGVQGLREEYTRTIDPARTLAAETLTLERTLSDLVKQGKGGKASAKIRLEQNSKLIVI